MPIKRTEMPLESNNGQKLGIVYIGDQKRYFKLMRETGKRVKKLQVFILDKWVTVEPSQIVRGLNNGK